MCMKISIFNKIGSENRIHKHYANIKSKYINNYNISNK